MDSERHVVSIFPVTAAGRPDVLVLAGDLRGESDTPGVIGGEYDRPVVLAHATRDEPYRSVDFHFCVVSQNVQFCLLSRDCIEEK